jgi:hypothetical protein
MNIPDINNVLEEKTFFNFTTLKNIYKDKDIDVKITIRPKYMNHKKKEYYLICKINDNFPNTIHKILFEIPNIHKDIKEFKGLKILEFTMLLNKKSDKMSLLSSIDLDTLYLSNI